MSKFRLSLMALMLALVASMSLSATAAAQDTSRTAPRGSDCDVFFPDVTSPDEIFPNDWEGRFNPILYKTQAQLWQYHSAFEDTYGVMILGPSQTDKIFNIYIHDKKSGQYCWGDREVHGNIVRLETGVLNNLSTSIELCIVPFKGDPECGKEFYREDAGGHRQVGRDGKRTDGKLDKDPQAELGYQMAHDYNEKPDGEGKTHDGYGVEIEHAPGVKTTVELGWDYFNWFEAEETYGVIKTDRPHRYVSVQSDRYGQGKWYRAKYEAGKGFNATTGVYYNKNDRLRVCTKVMQDGHSGDVKCGKWHDG